MGQIILAIESNRSRAPQLINATLKNFLVERQPQEAKSQTPLFNCPGIAAWLTSAREGASPALPCRGMIEFHGFAYAVLGDQLWRLDATGIPVQVGGTVLIPGTSPVGMANNGVQLIIVNGLAGWTFDTDHGLQQITAAAFYAANSVIFMDGYFILNRRDTNEFFLSALYDGRTYGGLDFATAEGQAGTVTAVVQNLELLYILTSSHIELWYNSGAADFPFQRYPGSVIPYGCIAPHSVVKQDGAVFFMGADKIFYRLNANQPVRISTHAIEFLIGQEATPEAIECFTFTIQGHKLIFVTLPSLNETVCYDISTGKWHDRESVDAKFKSLGRYRGRFALEIYNSILIGDAFDGRVGKVQWETYTEYGLPMLGEIDTITQHHDRKRIFCHAFELDIESGVGLVTGQGSDPQVMARKSKDGSMTFGVEQPWRSMGKIGEYGKRLRWTRQGNARQFSWRIQVTDPVPRTIIAAHAEFEEGLA